MSRRRIRAALSADYDMNVNLKLFGAIMTDHGLYGLPRPGRRQPNLIRVSTPADLVNRRFTDFAFDEFDDMHKCSVAVLVGCHPPRRRRFWRWP